MKFHLAINMERLAPDIDMRDVERHTLEMVQMADQGGFETVWAAEHHALEMTIAPNPFQILTWWAGHTDRIRLGSAVAVAAYWHPIDLAGEAALLDGLEIDQTDSELGRDVLELAPERDARLAQQGAELARAEFADGRIRRVRIVQSGHGIVLAARNMRPGQHPVANQGHAAHSCRAASPAHRTS